MISWLPLLAQGSDITREDLDAAILKVVNSNASNSAALSWLGTSLIISSVVLAAGLLVCTYLLIGRSKP